MCVMYMLDVFFFLCDDSSGTRARSVDGRWFRVVSSALSIRLRPELDAPLAGELPYGEVFQAAFRLSGSHFRAI